MSEDIMDSRPGELIDFTDRTAEEFAAWATGWWVRMEQWPEGNGDACRLIALRPGPYMPVIRVMDRHGNTDWWYPVDLWARVSRIDDHPTKGDLQAAIDGFCAQSSWGTPAWKAQPHIARLFELRSKGEDDE